MNEEQRAARMALIEEIHSHAGEKKFAVEEVSWETFAYLTALESDGLIERMPSSVPFTVTYRLKSKDKPELQKSELQKPEPLPNTPGKSDNG